MEVTLHFLAGQATRDLHFYCQNGDSMIPEMPGKRVLIIDDQNNIRKSLRLILEAEGAIIDEADSCLTASKKLEEERTKHSFDLVFLDVRLPDGTGLDLLKSGAGKILASRTLVMSGEGTAQDAFQAVRFGAFDFIDKPFSTERILVTAQRCLAFNHVQDLNRNLSNSLERSNQIVGQSAKILELKDLVAKIAPTNGRVLILGESGTGKELVAKSIHFQSNRKSQPLIKVNCAAIPQSLMESELFGHEKGSFTGANRQRKGVFELAHLGTIFLDEVGELDLGMQAALLRVLQTGEFTRVGGEQVLKCDVRVIAATNRDLAEMVSEGTFREDLYYRLNVVSISVPPLRDRISDIDQLAEIFVAQACEENSLGIRYIEESALHQLKRYHWPGNVRELRNVIERAVLLSDSPSITAFSGLESTLHPSPELPVQGTDESDNFKFSCSPTSWHDFHEKAGRAYICHILRKTEGNISEAARILSLERAYLHRLMKKLAIHREVVLISDAV